MKSFAAVTRILVAGMLVVLVGSAIAQQPYPTRPIRLIRPYGPGGGNDIMARLSAQKLTESRGQQVSVDYRPGANTIVAA